MPTWFLSTAKYQQSDDSAAVDTRKDASSEAPKFKTVTEPYLIDAVSHTEAEAKLTSIMTERGGIVDFEVVSILHRKFSDVFELPTGEGWYKCKTYYMTEDDKGRSKKVNNTMLINASSLREANTRLEENLSSMLVPVIITGIDLTPILEVVKHEAVIKAAPAEGLKATLA